MLKQQYVALSASSLLIWATECIYREISRLPLTQWAPLVLGINIVTTGGLLAFQTALLFSPSNWVTHKLCWEERKSREKKGMWEKLKLQ